MNAPLRYDESAECWLPAQLEHVAPALARLGTYLTIRGLAADVWQGIELAVAEALNNAVMHGSKGREEEGVILRWTWSDDTLVVTVHDPSDFMPDVASSDLPEDPLDESGRGHFLMATLMDEVAHILVDGHHALELKKVVGPMSWSPQILADTEAALNSLTSELGSCYESLTAVFRFSENLATVRNFDEFAENVLQRLNSLAKAEQSYIRLPTKDKSALQQTVSVGRDTLGIPKELGLEDTCVEAEVFKTQFGKINVDAAKLHPEDPLRHAEGSFSVCPITFRGEVLGCLTVVRPVRSEPFLVSESALIRVAADFLGIAYVAGRSDKRRQLEKVTIRELEIASSIQQSLLPHEFPAQPPYRTFGLCRSARQVGGDYFDIIPIDHRGLLLVVADVMGKGIPASLLATIFRTAVQARKELATKPGKLLTEVNRQLAPDLEKLDMFITAKLAFLSYEENTLYYTDAGHGPILVRRRGEPALLQIQADGFPLGISARYEYPAEIFPIKPGDILIFLTDGIYENLEENGLASSFEYLMQQILTMEFRDLPDFCNQLLELSEGHADKKPLLDDRTILVLEREK